MKSFSRRSFLRLCGKTFLALGFGSMLPKSVAAAAKPPALRVIASRTLPLENDKRFRAIVFSDSQCGNDYDVWARTFAAAFDRHGARRFITASSSA